MAVGKSVFYLFQFLRFKFRLRFRTVQVGNNFKLITMLNIQIKTEDFIDLVNSGVLNIPLNEIEEIKSKIKINPIKNGNNFFTSTKIVNEELKKIILTYSTRLELI